MGGQPGAGGLRGGYYLGWVVVLQLVSVELVFVHDADGAVSLVTISPGVEWVELVVGNAEGKRTLTLHDYQHEYVFVER